MNWLKMETAIPTTRIAVYLSEGRNRALPVLLRPEPIQSERVNIAA
jgi:hypothetical protein